ncbi:MAG: hypothetical protein U0992_15685 [Planctomycetaceae bacterium]
MLSAPRKLRSRRVHRAGFAPIELILSLPMLLMLMAMIVIVGTAGAWKIRTLATSRQAAARSIWPRDGAGDPKPASWWPDTAAMSAGPADPLPIDYDPFAQHTVVRGPVVGAAGGAGLRVNTGLLDVSRGLMAGFAAIDRDLPLWKQLPWRNRYRRETQVFAGDQWQFQQMGFGDNVWRRVPVLYPDYNLATASGVGLGSTATALQQLLTNPQRNKLLILDRDSELRTFYGKAYESDWYGRYDRFNFHPPARNDCSLDLRDVVDDLKMRINQVPCNVARAFRDMYRAQQNDAAVQQLDQFLRQSGCRN